jgi:hypothetical protein
MVKCRAIIKIQTIVFLSLIVQLPVNAQTSEHQRIGVERKTDWELGFELGSGMSSEVRILPGAKIKVTSVVTYSDAAESLKTNGLSVGDSYFE